MKTETTPLLQENSSESITLTLKKYYFELFFISGIATFGFFANLAMYEPGIKQYTDTHGDTIFNHLAAKSIIPGLLAASWHGATSLVHAFSRNNNPLPLKLRIFAAIAGFLSTVTVASQTAVEYSSRNLGKMIYSIFLVVLTYGPIHTLSSMPIINKIYEKASGNQKKSILERKTNSIQLPGKMLGVVSALLSTAGAISFLLSPYYLVDQLLKNVIAKWLIQILITTPAAIIVSGLMAIHGFKAASSIINGIFNFIAPNHREIFLKQLPIHPKTYPKTFAIIAIFVAISIASSIKAGIPSEEYIDQFLQNHAKNLLGNTGIQYAIKTATSFGGTGAFYLGLILEAIKDIINLFKDGYLAHRNDDSENGCGFFVRKGCCGPCIDEENQNTNSIN